MTAANNKLPWKAAKPLMLAPMQGLTNRALRGLFIDWVNPDVVFTEFVRVRPGSKKSIADADKREVQEHGSGTPLVVQLIGRDADALVAAANTVQELGAEHLNINMGCPYGRMTSNSAGGALLKDPSELESTLTLLRREIHGSFSIKLRSGYEDPGQVFELLPIFESCGVDFVILHPRTVKQRYAGAADHAVTREVVERTNLPVIANGDIFSAASAAKVMEETKATGLMLGRGAIADPLLFERIRHKKSVVPSREERAGELVYYLSEIIRRYNLLYCGQKQVLCKVKEVLSQIHENELYSIVRDMKRSKNLSQLQNLIELIPDSL